MPIAAPITRQTAGQTFTIALAVLGIGVLLQLGAVGWAFVARFHAEREPVPAEPPMFARLTAPVGMRPDFTADPFSTTIEEAPTPGLGEMRSPGALARPVPVPAGTTKPAEDVPQTRFDELVQQGKYFRDRGDTANALTRFREAGALDPRNPIAIAELAATLEAMRLPDKAAEQWKRIYEMGRAAGIYFSLAESKLREVQAQARLEALGGGTPMPPGSTGPGTTGGSGPASVAVGKLRVEERNDAASQKRFKLVIPIKALGQAKIEAPHLAIHVLFYDRLDGTNVVQTSANVNSKWVTAPADWADSDTEELAVEYQLPLPEKGSGKREFYGYLVRIYYKGQLQTTTAEPARLADDYPAPATLPRKSDL